MRLRCARLPGLAAAAVVLGLVVSGCAQPDWTYVSSSDRDVVMKVPRTWSPVNTDKVLKAGGTDPSTTDYGWLVYYDGDSRPNQVHPLTLGNNHPVLEAHSTELGPETQAALTDDFMRDVLNPVTQTARDSDALTRSQAGQAPREFSLVSDRVVNTRTEHGVHTVYAYTSGANTEYYDQFIVTDPKKTKIHWVLVHCSKACYQADKAQIDAAVDSFTLKKP